MRLKVCCIAALLPLSYCHNEYKAAVISTDSEPAYTAYAPSVVIHLFEINILTSFAVFNHLCFCCSSSVYSAINSSHLATNTLLEVKCSFISSSQTPCSFSIQFSTKKSAVRTIVSQCDLVPVFLYISLAASSTLPCASNCS